MESLTEVIEEIEQGKLNDAKNSEVDLIEDMIDLEVATLKVTHLNEAFSFFERASDIDADELAELTYDKASNTLDSAVNFIETSYRDREGVKAAGINALIAAKKAYYVAVETENLVKMAPEAAEKHMLNTMELFNKMHLAAKGSDIVPDKLFNQSETIVNAIKELKYKAMSSKKAAEQTSQTFAAPITSTSQLSVEPLQPANTEANPPDAEAIENEAASE